MIVTFTVSKEGQDKVTYKESYPGGVIGNLYLSRLACHFLWNSIPKDIEIEIKESNNA